MRYLVVLHSDDGHRYGATVPDLPGCFSGGETLDQALDSVHEAIELHLEGITEDGKGIPDPHPTTFHQKNPDYAAGIWGFVDVDTSKFDGPAEKINITIPRRILVKVDDYAKTHGLSRSGFLVQAAERAMR